MINPYADTKWDDLHHAYGPASLTPQHIAGLLDPDKHVRDHALSQLLMSIWHQGTIYPATIKAIPHIIDVVTTTPYEKNDVAALLACLVSGEGYFRVHAPYIGAREAETLKRDHGIIVAEEIDKENGYIAVAREYAIICWPILRAFMRSDNSTTRECVAMAIGAMPMPAAEAIALLESMRSQESDASVLQYIDQGMAGISRRS